MATVGQMDRRIVSICLFCSNNHPLPYFDGVLAPNDKLQDAAKLLEGKISGPESITSDRNGKIFIYFHR